MIKTVYGPPPADEERIEDINLEQDSVIREENVSEKCAGSEFVDKTTEGECQ